MQIFKGYNFRGLLKSSSFIFKDHLLSTLGLHMHCDCFKNFEDLIFMDEKLLTKAAKTIL